MRIRCSSIGGIMTNSRKKGELSKTTQSAIIQMVKEETYGVKSHFSSKQIEKGLIMEDDAIDLVAKHYGLGMVFKNEDWFQNGWVTGTPDVITKATVRDIKCSWSLDSFPLFDKEVPNKGYYWQLQGYMWLTNRNVAYLDYCLMDTPQHLIQSEMRKMAFSRGEKELDKREEEKILKRMIYSNHETELRIKSFKIPRDDEAIESIKVRVEECREFYQSLINQIS